MRKKRLLIIGCGDVIQRALPWLKQRFKVYATASSTEKALQLHTLGVTPLLANLDCRASLSRIAGLADHIIYSAPPAAEQSGQHFDLRMKRAVAALAQAHRHQSAILPQRHLVYISTSGVYGDHAGAWITECSAQRAKNARALRRQSAESQLRAWAIRHVGQQSKRVSLLRAPGIYALDRLPTARIERGEPGIIDAQDSISNHIHAQDLAHAVCLALFRGLPQRAYNIVDDEPHTMSHWFDQVADFTALPRVERVSRAQAQTLLSPAMLSYMNESRRIDNQRAKRELRWRLKYPTTQAFFAQHYGQYIATSKY